MFDFITSFYEGRIRIRHDSLKNKVMLAMLNKSLSSVDGIIAVTSNVNTGSLLIEYNQEKLSTEELIDLAAPFVSSFTKDFDKNEFKAMLKNHLKEQDEKNTSTPSTLVKKTSKLNNNALDFLKNNNVRKTINYTMLASLGLSVGFSVWGSKNAHVLTGGAFLFGLSLHMLRNRKAL